MAAGIVDALEVVEVDEAAAEVVAMALGTTDLMAQRRAQAAVVEAIEMFLMDQALPGFGAVEITDPDGNGGRPEQEPGDAG
jgi:hypothetical protein